ncbi:MAG: radical SAM protein [Patescibacteria group bacterium]
MKIIGIEPKSPHIHIFTKYAYIMRLGLVLLGTILKKSGHDVKIFVEEMSKIDWEEVSKADLVMISTITSTTTRAYDFASQISARGIPVILGGPHPTAMPEEAINYADFVVRGEGEDVILSLIEAIKTGSGFEKINGLYYKLFGKIYCNQFIPQWCVLDKYPIPDFSLIEKWGSSKIVSIQTSRGCPYNCKFCSVTEMFGRKMRFKSDQRVIDEIKLILPCPHIFFCDDNFAANINRTKRLLRRMICEKLNIQWSTQVRTEAAKDEELVMLMKKAGCLSVCIGMESVNPESLKEAKKKQSVEDIVNSIKSFHDFGIRVHGMFVIGFDSDDINTIKKTTRFAIKNKIDSVQIMILTPLPGTPVFEELKQEGRLLHTDWSRYDAHHVVFKSKIYPERLQIEAIKATAKFYSWWQIIKRFVRLDSYGITIKFYGHNLTQKWKKEMKDYIEELKDKIK